MPKVAGRQGKKQRVPRIWVQTGYHKWKPTAKPLIIVAWNVRTLDDPPTKDEVAGAIAEMQCGKSAGPDDIPPEVFKAGSQPLIHKEASQGDGRLGGDLQQDRPEAVYVMLWARGMSETHLFTASEVFSGSEAWVCRRAYIHVKDPVAHF
ncbi:hypothetical protein ACOMHN_012813 [Nucella lapillus]